MREAVVETDTALRIVAWNQGAERIYGWPAAEVLGRPAPEVLGAVLTDAERTALARELQETGHVLELVVHRTRAGEPVELESSVLELRDATGTLTGYLSVSRDVSLRRR